MQKVAIAKGFNSHAVLKRRLTHQRQRCQACRWRQERWLIATRLTYIAHVNACRILSSILFNCQELLHRQEACLVKKISQLNSKWMTTNKYARMPSAKENRDSWGANLNSDLHRETHLCRLSYLFSFHLANFGLKSLQSHQKAPAADAGPWKLMFIFRASK